jgi:hypothetical protein
MINAKINNFQNLFYEIKNYFGYNLSPMSLIEFLKEDFPFIFIVGVLFIVTYFVIFFFKDLFITYLKKDDRAYYYKYVNLKPHIRPIILFSLLITTLWGVALLISHWKIIIYGYQSFIIIYLIYNLKYYLWDKNEFDYFDDLIWIYKFYNSKYCNKIKHD